MNTNSLTVKATSVLVQMMKKNIYVYWIILSIVLLSTAYYFFATEKVSVENVEDKSEVRMLNDLLGYIYHCEMMYTDILWALDYFERFDSKKSWENLQLAGASLAIAKSDITKRKLPAVEMTSDDEKNFIKRGIDLSFIGTHDIQFKGEQRGLMTTCAMFTSYIMNIWDKDCWEISMRSVAVERKIIDCFLQELANRADWVLASLNNPKATEKFNSLLEEYCPQTHARQRKNPDTTENIEASTQALFNQIGDLIMELSKLVGAAQHILNIAKEADINKNWQSIRKNITQVSDLPLVIHTPNWLGYGETDINYYWEENGKVTKPAARTELTRVPDICSIKTDGITLEQVKAYENELKQLGLQGLWNKEEQGKYTVFCNTQNSIFAISWENKKVTITMIKNPVCLVPIVYISAILRD